MFVVVPLVELVEREASLRLHRDVEVAGGCHCGVICALLEQCPRLANERGEEDEAKDAYPDIIYSLYRNKERRENPRESLFRSATSCPDKHLGSL